MSADTTQQPDQPATLEELKKAFPKADADFVLNQLSDSATMESATRRVSANYGISARGNVFTG